MLFELRSDMAPAKVFVERSATISGHVTDPDGKPVEGATVIPARNGRSLTGDTRFSVKTDQDGRYVMHIPASKNSTYNILAHDGEYEQWRKWANGVSAPFQTTPGQTVENIDLQLTRPGRVTGRVLRKGQPVANYLVRTVASDLREHSYYNPATKTNADGTFELTHVRPGKHFLQVGFYMYGKDKDQGPVIEVAAGEVVADQLVEAKEQRDPEEGVVKPPEPEPTVANPREDTQSLPPQLDFAELTVSIEPHDAPRNGYQEKLRILRTGQCWYSVETRTAVGDLPERAGAVFDHQFSSARIVQLNQLLQATQWLTEAPEKSPPQPPGLHATLYKLSLKRSGQTSEVVFEGRGTEPQPALTHFLEGIAAQERRVYLHDYLSGEEGTEAWQEIGRELAALRGEPYGKSPYDIDYTRYLPIAVRIVRDHHGKPDEELITAVRLIGHLRAPSELEFIHRMAQDRSSHVRQEVAWALGRIHNEESLPVLLAMMSAAGTRWEVGFELIQWGNDAVPGIVKLIGLSTKDGSDERERVTGEDMIRAYLQHWDKIPQPIHEDVIAAVKQALEAANPQNGGIRTTYHQEFLKKGR